MTSPRDRTLPPIPPQSTLVTRRVDTGGGGVPRRVLGSAKALSPAVQKRTAAGIASNGGNISPSASTVSLGSTFSEGGTALEAGGGAVGGGGGAGGIVCPICSEEMVTLLQLNRHLDDVHREVEEEEKDDVKTWFRKRVLRAKQFQPVAVINQKLKGLDIFESNNEVALESSLNGTGGGGGVGGGAGGGASATGGAAKSMEVRDPDEFVTKAHWQKSTANDYCLDPACRRPLGVVNGSVNCRKCGKLFCEEHTMYQIKLSRSAQHEPVRGFWCRVCETCFKSREGYNDHNGFTRDHTKAFLDIRRKTVDRSYLEVTRLEKRLTKLTQLLTNPPSELTGSGSGSSFIWTVPGLRNQRRQLEQKVVAWEDDAAVSACPYCKQTFSSFSATMRKHHCRLCGRVVCGDIRTGCSTEVGLNVTALSKSPSTVSSTTGISTTLSEKQLNNDSISSLDVRICRECKTLIFSRRDFESDLAKRPPDVRAYATLVQFSQTITHLLPRFQNLLHQVHQSSTPSHQLLHDTTTIRKKLLKLFTQYDTASKHILNLPVPPNSQSAHAQKKLQTAIYTAATTFLQESMLPLKSVPKELLNPPRKVKKGSAAGLIKNGTGMATRTLQPSSLSTSSPSSMLAEGGGGGAEDGSGNRPVISGMDGVDERNRRKGRREMRETELKSQLIVLEEQKFLLEEMLSEARKARRFDEVGALSENLDELDKEVERVGRDIEMVEMEGEVDDEEGY